MSKSTRFIQTPSKWTDFHLARFIYFNRAFDKSRLKGLVKWTLARFGEKKTIDLVETLKSVGYTSATQAGLSLSIDDLLIPPSKIPLITQTEAKLDHTQRRVSKGYLTSVEYLSQVITTWNVTNDVIKNQVIAHFRSKDVLNPVYMMAFSGARGNISQVRQLVGMRGLMSDPNGKIIDYAIQSNFREGLTLTEYVISCYGARKGVVDTALRTATSGYLTRRLVDVAQHVVIRLTDCSTTKGIYLTALENEEKIFMTGSSRLVGRILAEDVYDSNLGTPTLLAQRNQEVTPDLASRLFLHHKKILVRSALTCEDKNFVCQLCYGWNLSSGRLVSVGETVGVIAAQSIGEPGTQLTMRTFHTGGVFSGEISKTLQTPVYGKVSFLNSIAGKCVRTDQGEMAFLTKQSGVIYITHLDNREKKRVSKVFLKPYTILFVKQGEIVYPNQTLAEISSLDRLSQKQQSFQTIFAPLSGEIKFRTARLAQGAHYPGHTTFVPLSEHASEFWILSAQIQKFINPLKIFVQPGDRVEFKSPVLTYISLAQTETHCFDSFAFQQYVSFYRLQTLFTVLQPSSNGLLPPTSSKDAPVYGANMVTKPSILVSPSLINRGTLIERVLPFIAFFPKQRFLFRWNQSKKPKKRQSKLTTQNDRQLKAKPQVRTQQKQKLKTNFRIKNPLLFKRFSTIQCQPCERPILSVYPFAFNQKTLIAFSLTPRFVHSLSRTMFSSMFKPTRQNEVQQFVFFAIWLTRFDKQLFLSSLSSLSNSETLVLKPYKQNFHLKQPEKFVDPYLGKKPTKHPFYCPWDKLWAIFYLKKPTPDFKQPFYAVFPQGLSWNLNQELERTVTVNPRISYTHPPFCFYYRLANHFRFQPFYEILLSKTFRCEQIFEPIELVECYEFEGEVRGRRLKMAFFPKSLVFLDRINQYIQQKAFILFLKQKQEQEKEQYQRFVKNDTNPINLQPTHPPQTFDNLQLQTNSLKSLTQKTNYLQLQNGQYVTNQPMRYLNKIFAFHEFTHFPFCFDAFPTEFKKQISKPMVNTPIHYSKLSTLTYCKNSSGVKLPVACAPGFFNIPHTVPNKKLRGLTLTKTKVQIEGLSQKTILLQLLISKAQPTWNKSKKFVGLTFSLIVCLYKLFIWKHIFKKQNQLRNVYQFKNWNPTKSRSKKLVPTKNSMYCFLKKVFYKKATIRSTHIQLRRFSAQKRAWFSIKKRRQIAMTRLSIVYCLTHALPAALLFTSFRVFTYPMFSTKQKKASSIFAPMFGFCFSFLFFETRYFRHWNHVFEHQIQMKFQQQWFFQKWTQNLALLLEQKQQKQQKQRKQQRQTKSKSLYKLKGSKFMVRSFMKFWFYRRRKNLPRLFPIKVTTSSFAAYQAVDVPRVEVFLQKNYENQFLNVFRNADSELTNFSMLFLLTGYPELMGCPFFQSRFSELCYDLNQSDKISLQNESLGHYWTQKNQTILCFLKKIKKSCSKTAKTTKTAKTAKIAKTAKTTKRGKAVKVDKTFKVNKALQTIKKFQYAESRNVVRLLASPFISSVSHEELWHGRHHQHLNPFGWVFFSTGLNRNFDCKLQKPGFKTGPTCQTLFAFSQETFQSMYDPWWRHQMHQLYVSSTLKCLQKQTISQSMRFTSFGRFMKHPNDFFSSYLEKSFFKQIISPNKETHVCKQSFINEIAFYTQAIRLKVKTVESLAKHDISCLNVHTLNYYVRLVFLKTAKLPLIVATKHPIRKTGLQKRLILLHLQQIYVSKNTRYRPAFVFDSLKYRKVKTKPVQTTVQFISKSPYVLSMLQKGVTHRTGDVLVKMFVQSELHHLNRVSFSGLMRPLRLQKDVQKNPPLNMSTFFHTSQLNMYQSTLLTYYFKPASWWLMTYQQLNLSATHLYVSHQFGPSGSLFTYSCAFVQTRHFGSFQHPIAKLDELVSMQKQVSTLNTGLSMVHMEKSTTITEVSQVEGFVLQCFDVTDKAKNAPSYEHDMRRFRHQPETLCSISYLTDTDMVTYQLSQPRQKLGAFISYGELVTDDCLLEESGQVIYLTKTKLVLRKAQCFLLASGSECDLNHGDLVSFGSPLLTVAYSQVESEDIIQGIPKIDQLFEARTRLGFFNLKQLLANKYEFLKKEGKQTKRDIVLESIDFIQKQIVDGVQMVYQSQGVTISDKHIEIIVKQMTSKVRVNTAIDTGFLRGDVVPFHLIEMGNFDAEDLLFECEPILLGITQAALQAEGFLSAASFQETIRILSQAAVIRKTDYLKNLKENIIVGHLLPSGTGLPSIVATKSRVNLTLPA